AVDAAVAVLRAEAIEPVPAGSRPPQDGLALTGRVLDVRFVGSAVHHRVEAIGRTLSVTRPFRGEESVLAEGGEVVLTWDPDDVRILPIERSVR
ncbi:MAG: TOBE domain-containing protein, partial [Actinomycetota bacterium]